MSSPLLPELTPTSLPDFKWLAPTSVSEAIQMLGTWGSKAKIIAGGSDLLHLMKRDSLVPLPEVLIDIKGIEGLGMLGFDQTSGLSLGSLVTIATIENNPDVSANFPLLSQATDDISSPQVRNVATVGGALSQQVWCSFLRNGLRCWRAGGSICYATQDGADNRYYQSVMGGSDCFAVHPSDLAVALEALDASVTVTGGYGSKSVSVADFIPGNVWMGGVLQSHILSSAELVTSVQVPPPKAGERSIFLKSRIRNAFDFAIASLAVRLPVSNGEVGSSRVVFGGIAPAPYRDPNVEGALNGASVSSIDASHIASLALSGSTPLQNNGYKVDVAKGLLMQALGQLLV